MLLTKFHIIWPSGFRGKAVLKIDQSLFLLCVVSPAMEDPLWELLIPF
jgi:hypothetical protein